MLSIVLTTLISSANPALAHSTHDHNQDGSCAVIDGTNEARSIPNLLKERDDPLMRNAQTMAMQPLNARSMDAAANGVTTLSVAVWYRPTYLDFVSEQDIHSRVDYWFNQINQHMRDSKAQIRLKPIFVKKMDYDLRHLEGDVPDDFSDWFNDDTSHTYHYGRHLSDSPISIYSALMETGDTGLPFFGEQFETDFHKSSLSYGADLYLWIQEAYDEDFEDGNAVGLASLLGAHSNAVDFSTAPSARGTKQQQIDATATTIMHEIGHNLGLYHQRDSYDANHEPRSEPYAYAYTGCGKSDNTRTVMWSSNDPANPRKSLYSNPNVFVDGNACGDPVYADQTRLVNTYAPIAAERGVTPDVYGDVYFNTDYIRVAPGQESVLLEVVRNGDLEQAAEVEVGILDGEAQEGVDFTGGAQQIVFGEGQERASAEFEVIREDSDTMAIFTAVLRYPLNVETAGATAVIAFEGTESNPFVGTIEAPASVNVSQNGRHTITLTRTGAIENEALVTLRSEDGSAVAGVNYIPFDGHAYFAPGEDKASFEFEALYVQGSMDFNIAVDSPMNMDIMNDYVNVMVLEGDAGAAHFNGNACNNASDCIANVSVDASESSSTTVPVELTRSGGDFGELSVDVTWASGSIDTDDLDWSQQTISFSDGQSSAEFDLSVPAGVTGNFTLELSTDADDQYLNDASSPALAATFTVKGTSTGGGDSGSDTDTVDRQGSAIHPIYAGLLLIVAGIVQIRRRFK